MPWGSPRELETHIRGRIRPSGPLHAKYLGVGEAGGYWENQSLRPFDGKSGRLLNTYLHQNSIPRERIRITNLYPYWTGPGDPQPTRKQIKAKIKYLHRSLRSTRPQYILALGRLSSQWFAERALDPDVGHAFTLEVAHGIPFQYRHPSWERPCWVIPSYHPAAGLRNPEVSGKVFHDIKQFSLIARGKLRPQPRVDTHPHPRYRLVKKKNFLIAGWDPAVDTEGFENDPYCFSFSTHPGRASVVLYRDRKYWKGKWLNHSSDPVIFHHAMHDLGVVRAMGLQINASANHEVPFHDTRLMARLLLLEPIGLKDLALRHCGMRMSEYEEVVGPYYRKACRSYVTQANERDWGKPKPQKVFDKATGKWRIKRPHSLNTRLKSILTSYAKARSQGKAFDFAGRYNKLGPRFQRQLTKKVGAFPTSHPRLAPLKKLVPYAARDADATRRLKLKLWPMIQALKLERAYYTDLGALPMFERMAHNGMQINPNHFASMRPKIVSELEASGNAWCRRYNGGAYLNLASGDQVAAFLFGQLGLKPLKLTDTGTRGSVDENTLELLKDQHPSIPGLMAWKKLHTNLTFVDRIPKHVRSDGRLYPNINTQGTVTGRPSTSDPQLLNIPVRTELGKLIRMGFTAASETDPKRFEKLLLSIDLSQIELRIGAHLSRDKNMIAAFLRGEDLHQRTADLLGIDRYIAKTINFGIFYGMTWKRLQAELMGAGIEKSQAECEEILRDWFRVFSGVKGWLEDLFASARRRGYVRGLSGRIRYLPNLYLPSGNPLRSEAERHAGNFPVQEGAGYVIKRAMKRMHEWLEARPEIEIRPLIQVYDEILFEMHDRPAERKAAVVLKKIMVSESDQYRVPLKADLAMGPRWGDLEKCKKHESQPCFKCYPLEEAA